MLRKDESLETPAGARGAVRTTVMVLVAVVALLLIPPPAHAVTVSPVHPRLLIYADSLAALRARCAGINHADYQIFYNHFDGLRGHTSGTGYWIDDWAALYAISGETKFAVTAIREAMKLVKTGGEYQGAWGTWSPIPLTYDWCYDQLTTAQKDSIIAYCVGQLHTLPPLQSRYRTVDRIFQHALAVWGEAGADNAFVEAKLQASIDWEQDSFLPCLDAISSGGVTGYYPGQFFCGHLLIRDCIVHACDYTGSILQSSWWANSPSYWMHRLRPDMEPMRMTGRYNLAQVDGWGYNAWFSSRLGNQFSQTIANKYHSMSTGGGGLSEILWYNPSLPAAPLSGLSTNFADEDYGYYIYRSGWDLGPMSTDTQIGFYNGPDVEPDHERTQNSFTVTRGGDDLLISGGRFYDSSDQHYFNYTARAVSRNTILVYDPSESFGSGIVNDGGQCNSDQARGLATWPECGAGIGYRGSARLIPPGPGVLFGVLGCASKAYSASKCRGVTREFLVPIPNWIVIQDRVTMTRPGMEVRLVFHSIERPTVDGHLEQLQGSAYGGIYRSTDTKVIKIERGNSVALIYPVYVRGGAKEVRLIGGASPNNLTWRQNVKSAATLTYVSNPSDQAYECWVDGANRSPTHALLTQAQMDSRNQEPNPCGDWRVEILVPATEAEVYAVTAIQIGPRGTPARTLDWSESGGRVTIEGISDDYTPHLVPPTHAE